MSDTNNRLFPLFTEVFQGTAPGADGTWFVQGNEAFYATIDDLTAMEASTRPMGSASSIAAHVIHTTYYMELAIAAAKGEQREGDWPSSWDKQTVSDTEWEAVKGKLRSTVAVFQEGLGCIDLDGEYLQGAVANIAHAAYHLGAIRQLYLAVKN